MVQVAIRPIESSDIEAVAGLLSALASAYIIGRMPWEVARRECEAAGNHGAFTVNSSNNAVPIYERWGFRRTGPARSSNGVVCNPMKLDGAHG